MKLLPSNVTCDLGSGLFTCVILYQSDKLSILDRVLQSFSYTFVLISGIALNELPGQIL